MNNSISRKLGLVSLVAAMAFVACNSSDPQVKENAVKAGFAEDAATELSSMKITPDEMSSITEAKKGGIDDAAILSMVKSLHKRDLKFDIGFAIQLLKQEGMGATAIAQLVDMGAIPRWADDIRPLKEAKVADVTILEIAKAGFQDKKELLSGGEYGLLKTNGLSDAGLITFVQKGGTAQQAQQLALQLALGKSEQESLRSVGM